MSEFIRAEREQPCVVCGNPTRWVSICLDVFVCPDICAVIREAWVRQAIGALGPVEMEEDPFVAS